MSYKHYYEKSEKEEKEYEKHEEKTVDEKWRRDPLGTVVWAAILIWAGLVLLAENLGVLSNFPTENVLPPEFGAFEPTTWSVIMLGAGVILLIEVLIRILIPTYRRQIMGSLIIAVVFIGVGLGNVFNWSLVFPLILIVVGLSIIFRGIGKPKE